MLIYMFYLAHAIAWTVAIPSVVMFIIIGFDLWRDDKVYSICLWILSIELVALMVSGELNRGVDSIFSDGYKVLKYIFA